MSREPLDMDMGDDDQADDIEAYERTVEDPPADYEIRNREADDDGYLGIGEELGQEWSRHSQAREALAEDDRPAEVAAVGIVEDTELFARDGASSEDLIPGEFLADEEDR